MTEAADQRTDAAFDFDALFLAEYAGIARLLARVARDPARAEELAAEVFAKLWRTRSAQGPLARAWLHKAALRRGLDELRRRSRREKYERMFGWGPLAAGPEELRVAAEQSQRVRAVLAALDPRQSGLLLLHSHGMTYGELAAALELNPASVGTLLSRAREAFRKEYVKRHGNES